MPSSNYQCCRSSCAVKFYFLWNSITLWISRVLFLNHSSFKVNPLVVFSYFLSLSKFSTVASLGRGEGWKNFVLNANQPDFWNLIHRWLLTFTSRASWMRKNIQKHLILKSTDNCGKDSLSRSGRWLKLKCY